MSDKNFQAAINVELKGLNDHLSEIYRKLSQLQAALPCDTSELQDGLRKLPNTVSRFVG
jgi:hypothetical protein